MTYPAKERSNAEESRWEMFMKTHELMETKVSLLPVGSMRCG